MVEIKSQNKTTVSVCLIERERRELRFWERAHITFSEILKRVFQNLLWFSSSLLLQPKTLIPNSISPLQFKISQFSIQFTTLIILQFGSCFSFSVKMNSHSSSSSELPPLPETLDGSSSSSAAHLVPVFSTLAGDSFYSPTRALSPPPPPPPPSLTIDDNGNIYAGVVDEDALKVVPGRDHSFQLLIDDPSSAPLYVLPPAGNQFGPVFSSRVTAVAPPDVLNPEPVCDLSWLFTNNSSSKNRISATPATSPPEAAPSGIVSALLLIPLSCLLIISMCCCWSMVLLFDRVLGL